MRLYRVGSVLSILLTAAAVLGSTLDVDTGSYVNPAPTVAWWGGAVYMDDQGQRAVGVALGASVGLWHGDSSLGEMADTVYGGIWHREAQTELDGGFCYTTSVAAETFDKYSEKFGSATCLPPPPNNNPPPVLIADDNQCGDPCSSPILLEFGSGQYRLSSAAEGVLFDIDADGRLERVAWPFSPEIAFLYLDRNGNNVPDDGAELFGDHALRADGSRARNGFDALLSYDANSDGRITPSDTLWSQLRLWFDLNRDGVAQTDEVDALQSRNLTALGTAAVWNHRRDVHGNVFLWKALFERGAASHPFYDVFLTMIEDP